MDYLVKRYLQASQRSIDAAQRTRKMTLIREMFEKGYFFRGGIGGSLRMED
jgi:hypothetical protein